jgi:hypothetical protein
MRKARAQQKQGNNSNICNEKSSFGLSWTSDSIPDIGSRMMPLRTHT